jgi:two-component system OmpR family sensor kinase
MPMVLAMLASLVSAALRAWHSSKPIRTLRAAFDAASTGNLETRVGPAMGGRRDDLADLGRDFDRMAGQLQTLMDGQRRLLHDVSHELRSPPARLQAAIGLACQRPERIDASLERIERESVRMDVLVGELLALSRLEAGVIGALEEEVNLGELVADIVDDARFGAEAVGKHVELEERGNAELLHRSIENVIRNAVKHTVADSAVHVSIASGGEQAEIGIRDHGPGVAEHELDAIFAPFFRGSGHGDDGHGLGLAIAKRTIEAHGGHIRASNVAQGGLHVDIFLPAGTKH